jgi:hypothetical protein
MLGLPARIDSTMLGFYWKLLAFTAFTGITGGVARIETWLGSLELQLGFAW